MNVRFIDEQGRIVAENFFANEQSLTKFIDRPNVELDDQSYECVAYQIKHYRDDEAWKEVVEVFVVIAEITTLE